MSWRSTSTRRALGALSALATLCTVPPALASPRSDPTLGRAVFTGAATANPTAIDINPAALGLGLRSELYIAALAAVNRYSIDRRDLDIDTGVLTDGPSGGAEYTISPGGTIAGVYHSSADSRITIGVQATTSPGERFVDRDDLRYHTMGGYYRTLTLPTVAGSVRITRRFYVGVSIGLQRNILRLRYARDTALEAGRDPDRGIDSDCGGSRCGVENPLAQEQYSIEVDSPWFSTSIISANLGIAVRLAKDMWLGVAYHTPPGLDVQNELTGEMNVKRAPRDGGDVIEGGASVYISQPASVDAELRARLPKMLELHVGGRFEHLSRFQSFDVRGYGSTLPPNMIPEWQPRPRGFHNAFALWAGVEQVEWDNPLVLGARIGIERSSLDDKKTSPLTIAPLSATLDFGLQYRLSDNLVVQASYGLQYFKPVDVDDSSFDPRARVHCIDSRYDYSTPGCARVRRGYAIPTAAGEYQRIEQVLRLGAHIAF